jgi:hypothetical protein
VCQECCRTSAVEFAPIRAGALSCPLRLLGNIPIPAATPITSPPERMSASRTVSKARRETEPDDSELFAGGFPSAFERRTLIRVMPLFARVWRQGKEVTAPALTGAVTDLDGNGVPDPRMVTVPRLLASHLIMRSGASRVLENTRSRSTKNGQNIFVHPRTVGDPSAGPFRLVQVVQAVERSVPGVSREGGRQEPPDRSRVHGSE